MTVEATPPAPDVTDEAASPAPDVADEAAPPTTPPMPKRVERAPSEPVEVLTAELVSVPAAEKMVVEPVVVVKVVSDAETRAVSADVVIAELDGDAPAAPATPKMVEREPSEAVDVLIAELAVTTALKKVSLHIG